MLPIGYYARTLYLRARALAGRLLIWLAALFLAAAKAAQGNEP